MYALLEVTARMPKRLLLVLCSFLLARCSLALETRYWKPVPETSVIGSDGAMVDGAGADGADGADIGIPDAVVADVVGDVPVTCGAACYTGRGPTEGVGLCHAGTWFCASGAQPVCGGEVVPAVERCNGIDDDCNGMVDDALPTTSCGIGRCRQTNVPSCVRGMPAACIPRPPEPEICGNGMDDDCDGIADDGCGCLWVSHNPGANDANEGTLASPLFTIRAAIARAAMMRRSVCLAAPAGCSTVPGSTVFDEQVIMAEGVHVLGGFDPGMAVPIQQPSCATIIRVTPSMGLAQTVVFPDTVRLPTLLDRVSVQGPSISGESAAVYVRGGGAILFDNAITGGEVARVSTGVHIEVASMAPVSVLNNVIEGGKGEQVFGIFARSPIVLSGSCGNTDTLGRCIDPCTSGRYVRVRGDATNPPAVAVALELENAQGSIIDQNALCANGGGRETFAVHVGGASSGINLLRNRVLSGGDSANSVGIQLDNSCAASAMAPVVIAFHERISTAGGGAAGMNFGVRNNGPNCRVEITGNSVIAGSEGGARNGAIGVRCDVDSQCRIVDNALVTGTLPQMGTGPMRAIGVDCARGGCQEVSGNLSVLGGNAVSVTGLVVTESETRVQRNTIAGGCPLANATGVELVGAFARLENNVISNAASTLSCIAPANSIDVAAVRVVFRDESRENDVHSNTIAADSARNCVARALMLSRDGSSGSARSSGIFRNNIFVAAGLCNTRIAFAEFGVNADPRVLENNVFFAPGASAYGDEGMTSINAESAINMLPGTMAAANRVADPMLGTDGSPTMGSPCLDRGTSTGAPLVDRRGARRPFVVRELPGFDIGALEFRR